MKRLRVWFVLLGFVAGASAAGADAERTQLAARRAGVERAYEAERAACATRFAVTACTDAARLRRRDALAALQARESRLEAEERRQRAAERQRQIDAKLDAARAGAASQPASTAPVEAAAARRAASASAGAPAPDSARRAAPRAARAASGASAEQARVQYERRQQEAQAHRREVEQRNLRRQQAGKRAAPLPVPASTPAR